MQDTADTANAASGMVEVSWSGKKLFIKASMLDEWRDQSFEQREAWVENHPWALSEEAPEYHPSFEGGKSLDTDDDIDEDIKKFQHAKKKKEDTEAPANHLIVHWNGKSLMLPRNLLDEWYERKSPEEKLDFVHTHPEVVIPM